MARLPDQIQLDAPVGAKPSGDVAPPTDYGLDRAAADLDSWARAREQNDQLAARQQAQKDDVAAAKALEGVQQSIEPAFREAATTYDGRTPGFARAQIAAFDQAIQPALDNNQLPPGVQAQLRRRVDAYRTGFGQRAIDAEAAKRAGVAAEAQQAKDGGDMAAALNTFNADFYKKYQGRVDAYDGTDPDFTKNVDADFAAAADAAVKAAPAGVQDALKNRLNAKRVEIYATAMEAADHGHDAVVANNVKMHGAAIVNGVVSNPTLYDSAKNDLEAVVQTLPAGLRTAARQEMMGQAAEARVEGLMAQGDFTSALAELKGGKYDQVLTPEHKEQLLRRVDDASHRGTLQDWIGREDLHDLMQSNVQSILETGQPVQGAPSPEEVNTKLGPEAAAVYQHTVVQANQMRGAVDGFPGMTAAQINARVAALKPQAGDPAFAGKQKAYEAALQQAGAEMEARAKDPAQWAITRSQDVRAAYADFEGATDPRARAQAAAAYGVKALAAQEAAGVPSSARRVLPREEAAAVVKSLQSADPNQKTQALDGVVALRRAFLAPAGSTPAIVSDASGRAGRVLGELIEAGAKPADVAAVIDLGSDPVRMAQYVRAATAPEAQIKLRERQAKELDRLDRSIRTEIAPYIQSKAPVTPDQTLQNGRIDMVRQIAYAMLGEGQSPEDAGKHAAQVLTAPYMFDGTGWRLPKAAAEAQGRGWLETRSPVTIARAGANQALQDLADGGGQGFAAGIDDPRLTEDQRRALYADKVTSNGRWVTTADDRGLALMYPRPDGSWSPALGRDGSPIVRDWPSLFRRAGGRVEPEGQPAVDNLAWRVERLGERSASGAVSPKGAVGRMQITPLAAKDLGADLGRLQWDDEYNRTQGKRYLEKMLKRYSWNSELAVAAYNAGPGAVDGWLKSIGDPRSGQLSSSEWAQRVPFAETRAYVHRVLGF